MSHHLPQIPRYTSYLLSYTLWNRRTDILTLYAGSQLAAQAEDLRDEVVADGTGRVHGLPRVQIPCFRKSEDICQPGSIEQATAVNVVVKVRPRRH